jgi:hypothetical protein
MISNLRRYVGATVLAAVVAAGVMLMPATAQAHDFDVCAQIEDAIAAIENSSLPDRAKDRIIDQLERLADENGCDEF